MDENTFFIIEIRDREGERKRERERERERERKRERLGMTFCPLGFFKKS